MKKLISLICMFTFMSFFIVGCENIGQKESIPLSDARTEELYSLSCEFTENLNNNNIDLAMKMMDENMKKVMDGKLEDTWKQLILSMGSFIKTEGYVGMSSDNYEVLEMTLIFEKGNMVQRAVFNKDNLITGLWYRNGEVKN